LNLNSVSICATDPQLMQDFFTIPIQAKM
jgi:hypothetical protein